GTKEDVMTKHLHLDLNGNRIPPGQGTVKISRSQLVLATIAHYGSRCTRAQAIEVLRLAGYNMKYRQTPLFTRLCKQRQLINIEKRPSRDYALSQHSCRYCGRNVERESGWPILNLKDVLTFTDLGR